MVVKPQPDKILIIDDDEAVRGFLVEMLRDEGYHAFGAPSGEAALERIATQTFDLALIDLRLGGIDGMQVLAAVREQSPDTICVMLTAHASLGTAVEALRYGAYDYLFKPCKTLEIRECVRSGLQQRRRKLRQQHILAQLKSLTDDLDRVDVDLDTPPPPNAPRTIPPAFFGGAILSWTFAVTSSPWPDACWNSAPPSSTCWPICSVKPPALCRPKNWCARCRATKARRRRPATSCARTSTTSARKS